MSSLVKLPLEVLLKVAWNLTTAEYGLLRLTCKHIERSVLGQYSQEFFTKRQFSLTEFSLQCLVDISESRMSSLMKHVILCLDRPRTSNELALNIARHGSSDSNDPTVRLRGNRVLEEFYSHLALINSNQHVTMLVRAFSNLANLRTVGIRDFNSHSLTRDGRSWQAYGNTTYTEDTDWTMSTSPYNTNTGMADSAQWVAQVFLSLLRVLAESPNRMPKIEILLRKQALPDAAFHMTDYIKSSLKPCLSSLETIFLVVNTTELDYYVYPSGSLQPQVQACSFGHIQLLQFLEQLPRLRHLRLNMRNGYDSDQVKHLQNLENTDTLLKCIVRATHSISIGHKRYAIPTTPKMYFDHLQQLELGQMTVHADALALLIESYTSTLKCISFHRVELSFKRGGYEEEKRTNLWALLLQRLESFGSLELREIRLSRLSQRTPSIIQHIAFHGRPITTRRETSWVGTNMRLGIRRLQDAIHVDDQLTMRLPPSLREDAGIHGDSEPEVSDDMMDEDDDSGLDSDSVDNHFDHGASDDNVNNNGGYGEAAINDFVNFESVMLDD